MLPPTSLSSPESLFEYRAPDSFLIRYRNTASENLSSVYEIYERAGFKENIVSVEQPVASAEINSQNFKITLESGKHLLLRRCHRL